MTYFRSDNWLFQHCLFGELGARNTEGAAEAVPLQKLQQ
jgi:hypothetical protein